MDHIEAWTDARGAIAHSYERLLEETPLARPAPPPHSRHVYHIYAIRHPRRDEAIKALQNEGVGVGIHYPVPVHLQKAYRDLDFPRGSLPVTERLAEEFLSLPIYPELKSEQVVEAVQKLKNVTFVEVE
jgi:dTDP-4-amino-4,6-dideoxygalactose transaminase